MHKIIYVYFPKKAFLGYLFKWIVGELNVIF